MLLTAPSSQASRTGVEASISCSNPLLSQLDTHQIFLALRPTRAVRLVAEMPKLTIGLPNFTRSQLIRPRTCCTVRSDGPPRQLSCSLVREWLSAQGAMDEPKPKTAPYTAARPRLDLARKAPSSNGQGYLFPAAQSPFLGIAT